MYFFDCNGVIGDGYKKGMNTKELLLRMNRLGIQRSLVWNMKAKNYNALIGNKELIDELSKIELSQKERLIPAFVIDSSLQYEQNGLVNLKELIMQYTVKCFFISVKGKSLLQINPIIDSIKEIHPLLFLNVSEGINEFELRIFLEKYSNLPIVCTNVTFSYLTCILGLMKEYKNIYIDTAFLHTRNIIELITKIFGEDHILFSTTPHVNGAGMASIMYAEISDKQKEKISAYNLLNLIGIKDKKNIILNSDIQNMHWNFFMQKKLPQLKILDAHGHIGKPNALVLEEDTIQEQIESMLFKMDKLGIETIFVSNLESLFSNPIKGNLNLYTLVKKHKKRFKGYVVYNPHYADELISLFPKYFSNDFFIGFKIHGDFNHIPLYDKSYYPVFDYANQNCLPILIHCYSGTYSDPKYLDSAIQKYKDAIFILGHSGGDNKGRLLCEKYVKQYKNVFLEFSGSFDSDILWEETITRVGSKKILFGTDNIYHEPAWELGRFLSLNLPKDFYEDILYNNMNDILKSRVCIKPKKD